MVLIRTELEMVTPLSSKLANSITKQKQTNVKACDKFIGSDDPKTMAPMDKCYSCYNGAVKAICTGKLVRSQIGLHQDWWVNSKNCIKVGGLCCDGTTTTSQNLHIRSLFVIKQK